MENATLPLATNCTVHLPATACAGFRDAREAFRTLLTEALGAGLQPLGDLPLEDSVHVSVYVAADVSAQLRRIAQATHLPLEKVAAGLAYARSIQRRTGLSSVEAVPAPAKGTDATTAIKSFLPSSSESGSAADTQEGRVVLQTRLRTPLMAGLNAGKIVFAEGGTGLGKSRVIAHCALDYLQTKKEAKVLILAPTVSVLSHLVREFRQVAPAKFRAFTVVLGRSQFVSAKRLESLLLGPQPDSVLASAWQAAGEWFKRGGLPSPLPGHRLAQEFSLCWLADELRWMAPDFPVDDVLLGGEDAGDAADSAELVYQALRLRAFDQKIKLVFATQTMACLNVWSLLRPDRQKGILPPFDLLLIDEAHELEEVMARTIGSNISLLHMRQVLRQGLEQSIWQKLRLATAANEVISHLDRAERVLRQIPASGLLNSWSDSDSGAERNHAFAKFLKVAHGLAASLEAFTKMQNEAADGLPMKLFQEWHRALHQMLDGRQNVWLDFSPVIRTPRLTVGPSQLIRPFEELWYSCHAAGLLSGTLYLPKADGRLSSGFMRMKLLVPRERAHEISPVHPSWNFTIPTAYLPDESAARELLYPGTAEDEQGGGAVAKWHRAVADRLVKIGNTAAGGTLVLCCSYVDVRAFSGLLAEDFAGRLLAGRGSGSLRALSEEFVRLGRQRMRPVWFATGSAWTGLDLTDHEAADPTQDVVLTDLVITRVPFGTNKTAVHLSRIKRLGFDVECMEAALRLKQGLGRLIRRSGVENRRIWVLDGRAQTRRAGYFKRVFGPVLAYPNRQFLA